MHCSKRQVNHSDVFQDFEGDDVLILNESIPEILKDFDDFGKEDLRKVLRLAETNELGKKNEFISYIDQEFDDDGGEIVKRLFEYDFIDFQDTKLTEPSHGSIYVKFW